MDGTYLEAGAKDEIDERFTLALNDIISRQLDNLQGHKVVFLFSHSMGVNPFLDLIGQSDKCGKPIYCTTVGCVV